MMVVPKVTIIDRIRADLAATIRSRHTPDYIVVTRDEYDELRSDPRVWQSIAPSWAAISATEAPAETAVETKTFRHKKGDYRQPSIQAISYEKFEGVPLYVVPEEYRP